MNLYLTVFLLLAAGSVLEWCRPRYEEKIYPVCWGMAAALLCLRFGQGTDYVTYHAVYETIPTVVKLSQGYICGFYPEVGWRLLCALFKLLHAPFWVFTMALGLAEMLLWHRFLKKYVPMKATGMFLLYPVLFFVYMASGLRQGLALCIFLGLSLPFYLEKKWLPYVLSVLFAASFHRVGYAWLVLVPIAYLPLKAMLFSVLLAAAGGMLLQVGIVQQLVVSLVPAYHVKQLLLGGDPSLFAIGERLFSMGLLCALYVRKVRREGVSQEEEEWVMKACLCGLCFYLLLSGNAYYASRYGAIFKVLEPVLIVRLAWGKERAMRAAAALFFGLALLMGVKNMHAAVEEGGYDKSRVNVLTYPYISVFGMDQINDYMDYPRLLEMKYRYNVEDQKLWMIEGH